MLRVHPKISARERHISRIHVIVFIPCDRVRIRHTRELHPEHHEKSYRGRHAQPPPFAVRCSPHIPSRITTTSHSHCATNQRHTTDTLRTATKARHRAGL